MPSVLVIDDEYGVRTGIREILAMEGYDVEVAETGKEALSHLAARTFDIALIDYQLPDIDGLSLLASIRERKLPTLTCMITAYANIDTAIAATRQGIDFFLPKPFSPDDLLGVMETLTAHKRLREEAERLRAAHEASLLALATEKSQTSQLVASLRDAVLVENRDGVVALVNQAMAGLLGKSPGEVVQRPVAEVMADPSFATVASLLAALGTDERRVGEVTLGDRIFYAAATRFHGDDGAVLGRILTLSDVTDMRRMAMEKPRFIRTMVHEFRSPLGAIRSLIEVALEKSLGDEVGPYLPFLERADKRIDKLVELISDLLSLSQIDLEKGRVRGDCDAEGAVAAVFDLYREHAKDRGTTLRSEVDAGLRLPLSGEDGQTVLSNLVGNAIKYGVQGGHATVRAGRDQAGVFLSVADDGLGIHAESLPRLFEEFFREKREETREITGNGLGLSIVKRLVDRAGGTLSVESAVGHGTTFTARFPG